MKKRLPLLLFLLYLAVVLRITVFRSGFGTHALFGGNLNLTVFAAYLPLLRAHRWGTFVYLFFGNIAWFVPFGFFLRRRGRSLPQTLLLGLAFSLTIETLQFVFATGVSELDDLILNTVGVGFGALATLSRRAPYPDKTASKSSPPTRGSKSPTAPARPRRTRPAAR